MNESMNNFQDDIINSKEILLRGGILLYPTDTIWGIGCDATNARAIKHIYALKKREESKSMIILVSDENMIRRYVADPSAKMLSYISGAGKPTTAIFNKAIRLPAGLVNEDGSIAIRIPNDPFCQQLIDALQKPLVSTSANISGEPFPQNFFEVSPEIKKGVDYIVQHRQQDRSKKSPSSIIRVNEAGEIVVIR